MPPTKASNLYSTFPLNPTRLPVTSDMACQKLSFTAHGQHGGSKDQIQWSNPSHFFFLQSSRYWTRRWQDRAGWRGCQRKRSCPEALIWRRKSSRSVHVTAGARALTVSHKRHWKAEQLQVAFAKAPLWKGRVLLSSVNQDGRGRACPALLNLHHCRPHRFFHSLKKIFLRVVFLPRDYFYLKKTQCIPKAAQNLYCVFSRGLLVPTEDIKW